MNVTKICNLRPNFFCIFSSVFERQQNDIHHSIRRIENKLDEEEEKERKNIFFTSITQQDISPNFSKKSNKKGSCCSNIMIDIHNNIKCMFTSVQVFFQLSSKRSIDVSLLLFTTHRQRSGKTARNSSFILLGLPIEDVSFSSWQSFIQRFQYLEMVLSSGDISFRSQS